MKVEGSLFRWPQSVMPGFWLHRETHCVIYIFAEEANDCGVSYMKKLQLCEHLSSKYCRTELCNHNFLMQELC